MIGPKILVKKMMSSPNYAEFFYKVKPSDVVYVKTDLDADPARYLVIKVSKSNKYIDMLPLEQFFCNQEKIEAPILSYPFDMIVDIRKTDSYNLFFLADQMNPHILKALEGIL
jgi:hypothetical protein